MLCSLTLLIISAIVFVHSPSRLGIIKDERRIEKETENNCCYINELIEKYDNSTINAEVICNCPLLNNTIDNDNFCVVTLNTNQYCCDANEFPRINMFVYVLFNLFTFISALFYLIWGTYLLHRQERICDPFFNLCHKNKDSRYDMLN